MAGITRKGQQLGSIRVETLPDDDAWPGDPATLTAEGVLAYVADHPDELDRILAAEREGKDRSTLIAKLEALQPETED